MLKNLAKWTSALCVCGFSLELQAQEYIVQRYSIYIQRDKLSFVDKGIKEANTREGRAILSAAATLAGANPETVNGIITAAQNFLPAQKQQDMRGVIQSKPGYTICYAKPVGPLGAGEHDIETHGDSTWNTSLIRVIPEKNQNFDGLAWYIVAPTKADTDTRVNGTYDIVFVRADPGWQSRFPGCRPTGEHPWLARNNHTRVNVACSVPAYCAPPGKF